MGKIMKVFAALAAFSATASAFQGPMAGARIAVRSQPAVNMAVEDMVGKSFELGALSGAGEPIVWDPLGFSADESALYRRRCVELKHGRICMVAFIGMMVGPDELIQPTDALLSPSLDLHFNDIPGGVAAIPEVPAAGWAQLIALIGIHEVTVAKQDYTKAPGDLGQFGDGFKPEDEEAFEFKQLV